MSNKHITDEQVMSMAVKAGFGPVFTTTSIDRLRALVEQAAALRPAAQTAEQWETSPKDAVQPMTAEPVEWQARCVWPNGKRGDWRHIEPTKTEPTQKQRADYLASLRHADGLPSYEVRALVVATTASQPVAVPDRAPMTDEDVEEIELAIWPGIQLDSTDRAVNRQFVQAVEAHHGITTPKADK